MGDKLPPVVSSLGETSEQAGVDVTVVAGQIKWFDASKGYGFIIPDNGMPDILLHVTVLRRDGYQTAYEGARIVCECTERDRGLQVPLGSRDLLQLGLRTVPAAPAHPRRWGRAAPAGRTATSR